ncbi:hypothetical protein EJB05_36882, partial [Eragrostis curvula]
MADLMRRQIEGGGGGPDRVRRRATSELGALAVVSSEESAGINSASVREDEAPPDGEEARMAAARVRTEKNFSPFETGSSLACGERKEKGENEVASGGIEAFHAKTRREGWGGPAQQGKRGEA